MRSSFFSGDLRAASIWQTLAKGGVFLESYRHCEAAKRASKCSLYGVNKQDIKGFSELWMFW